MESEDSRQIEERERQRKLKQEEERRRQAERKMPREEIGQAPSGEHGEKRPPRRRRGVNTPDVQGWLRDKFGDIFTSDMERDHEI
jgi:hypothetical protein